MDSSLCSSNPSESEDPADAVSFTGSAGWVEHVELPFARASNLADSLLWRKGSSGDGSFFLR